MKNSFFKKSIISLHSFIERITHLSSITFFALTSHTARVMLRLVSNVSTNERTLNRTFQQIIQNCPRFVQTIIPNIPFFVFKKVPDSASYLATRIERFNKSYRIFHVSLKQFKYLIFSSSLQSLSRTARVISFATRIEL